MEWIDLLVRYPEIGIKVLVCDEFNTFVSFGKLLEINEDGETIFELMDLDKVEPDSLVTHWMPVPQPVGILNEF